MANFAASSGADSRGFHLEWSLVFNDAADTVTIDAVYSGPAPTPQVAKITITLNTSVSITLDLLTARLSTGQLFDGNAATMLNSGPRTRTGVRLKISADRAALITHSTEFLP